MGSLCDASIILYKWNYVAHVFMFCVVNYSDPTSQCELVQWVSKNQMFEICETPKSEKNCVTQILLCSKLDHL